MLRNDFDAVRKNELNTAHIYDSKTLNYKYYPISR